MGETSIIGWTHSTWNPWRGCDKVSPGCAHCYMFRDQERYGRDPWDVVRCSDGVFYAPVKKKKWAEARERFIAKYGRHLVFTCSWSDWFHEDADPWRPEAWEIIRDTPRSIYQVLTKRPERILENLPPDWGEGYPNVWLGVTVENRRFVDRADLLRAAPAKVRFISAEPLLGPLVHELALPGPGAPRDLVTAPRNNVWRDRAVGMPPLNLEGIDWIITGGESGTEHRKFDPKWATDLRDVAAKTGTAFFHKQNGGPRPDSTGRALDGQEYDEMPPLEPVPELMVS